MSDLINRQAAIEEIDEWIKAFRENGHKESAADACLIQDGIIQLPSAQTEIVRCKDCKWFDESEPSGTVEPIGYRCKRRRIFVDVDDFCKRGERREE